MTDVILAGCRTRSDDEDDEPLWQALAAAKVSFEKRFWDDASADWLGAKIVLPRSTWDYHQRLPEFLAWCERLGKRLLNPLPVVRWNTDKHYLLDLQEAGLPIIPTALVAKGTRVDLAALLAERGWDDAVVKPCISAGGWSTVRGSRAAPGEAQALVDELAPTRDLIVQPFVATVMTSGERSVIWIDGEVSHSVRKRARWEPPGAEADPATLSDDEAALARRAVAAAPHRDSLLYARADMVRDANGTLMLMELELTEPTLFFRPKPAAAERIVAALRRRLAAA